jgi:hypothetical protein
MAPTEATRVSVSAIEHETDPKSPHWKSYQSEAMSGPFNESALSRLTDGLVTAVGRLDAAEAAKLCGQTGNLLSSRLEVEPSIALRTSLGSSLARIAGKMGPVEASQVCNKAIEILLRARSEKPQYHDSIDACERMLLLRLEPRAAIAWARTLCTRMVGEAKNDRYALHLNSILTDTSREQVSRRMAQIAKTGGPGFEGTLEAAARVFAETFPCRLTTQELVDLLKMPTCFGAARRVVLDHLGNRYARRFVNHWAFVRFATDQKLNLDFTTPPRRAEWVR